MGKDTGWKEYFSDNRRYADLINGLVCGGKQLVTESDLRELDTQTGRNRLKIRDLVRKVAFGMNFAIVGVENQEMIDYSMALRNMAYDTNEYERQAAVVRREVRKSMDRADAGEYLYGFRNDSRLHPVVTFILYAGVTEWNGPRSLREMLDFTDIPSEMRNIVQDYRLNLIELRKWEDTSVFQTDVRQVFDFIRCSEDKEALAELVMRDPYYQEMEEDAYDVVACYAHADELAGRKDNHRKDGKIDMCTAIREMVQDGIELGKVQGIELGKVQGIELGISQGENRKTKRIIENMLERGMADEDIAAIAECDLEMVQKIRMRDPSRISQATSLS